MNSILFVVALGVSCGDTPKLTGTWDVYSPRDRFQLVLSSDGNGRIVRLFSVQKIKWLVNDSPIDGLYLAISSLDQKETKILQFALQEGDQFTAIMNIAKNRDIPFLFVKHVVVPMTPSLPMTTVTPMTQRRVIGMTTAKPLPIQRRSGGG